MEGEVRQNSACVCGLNKMRTEAFFSPRDEGYLVRTYRGTAPLFTTWLPDTEEGHATACAALHAAAKGVYGELDPNSFA